MGLLFDHNCCVRTSQCILSGICYRIIRELDASLFVSVGREEEESMYANELSMFNLNVKCTSGVECTNILENPLNKLVLVLRILAPTRGGENHDSSSPEPAGAAGWFRLGYLCCRQASRRIGLLHKSCSKSALPTLCLSLCIRSTKDFHSIPDTSHLSTRMRARAGRGGEKGGPLFADCSGRSASGVRVGEFSK